MKRFLKSKLMVLLLAVVMSTNVFLLTGCGFFDLRATGIRFNVPSLTVELGSIKNIGSSIVEVAPTEAVNTQFTLSGGTDTSGNIIFEVSSDSSRIVAKALGTAVLTATSADRGYTAAIPVTVTYASVKEVAIEYIADGLIIANDVIILPYNNDAIIDELTFTSSVNFSQSSKEYCDPTNTVDWNNEYDGAKFGEQTKKVTESYAVSPTKQGNYTINVTTEDNGKTFTDWQSINVCEPILDANFTANGNLAQAENSYQNVQFTLNYTNPVNNPTEIIEWFVNDKLQAIDSKTFTYKPTIAGLYNVSAKINGKTVMSDGASAVKLIAKGTITPQNVTIDYENCFPKVIVRWDEITSNVGYSVSIINNNTGRAVAENLNTNNPEAKKYFTKSSFDATSFLPKNSVFSTTYSVSVMTLKDSEGIFSSSGYSNVATTIRLDSSGESFLQKKYYDGNKNFYISDFDNEFLDWFSYIMVFRGGAGSENKASLYLAFPFTNATELLEQAFNYTHFTGNFTYGGTKSGKVMTAEVSFKSDGIPSKQAKHTVTPADAAWDSMRPHVNYDLRLARSTSTVFAIDLLPKVKVENSEQLYYVAELGYCPDPIAGSDAARYYEYARRILRNIITDVMTDVEKAHAIYDWVMWRVNYDHDVIKISEINDAVKYEAYYLESVFTDTDFYSVCDGMSKAYSLMCNIEGLKCMRVTGSVSGGGHAWNKVRVDNAWYIVDCTWGDMSIPNYFEIGKNKEIASHMYFLVSDADVVDHIQDPSKSYPVSMQSYNWYDKVDYKYNDATVDFYIDEGSVSSITSEAHTLVGYMLNEAKNSSHGYAVGADASDDNNQSYSEYLTFDIRINTNIAKMFDGTIGTNIITSAFANYGKFNQRDYSIVFISDADMKSLFLFVFIKY